MTIILKNKVTLLFDDFIFRCVVGKNGLTKNKIEGDKKTPTGTFSLSNIYYRSDKKIKPYTKLKSIKIKKKMVWCNDLKSIKKYNKLMIGNTKLKHEKLFRKDYKYNYLILIKYNYIKTIPNKGSAIFIHLTKNYKPTAGCIGLLEKDFKIMVKLIKKNTKIKIS